MMLKPAAVADPKDINWEGGWKAYGELFSGKAAEVIERGTCSKPHLSPSITSAIHVQPAEEHSGGGCCRHFFQGLLVPPKNYCSNDTVQYQWSLCVGLSLRCVPYIAASCWFSLLRAEEVRQCCHFDTHGDAAFTSVSILCLDTFLSQGAVAGAVSVARFVFVPDERKNAVRRFVFGRTDDGAIFCLSRN